MFLIDRFIARVSHRAPDFQIGGAENPYCNRWWVIPRNRLFNIYLHQFVRDDDDRALHTHPWINCSIPLRVGYGEVLFNWSPWGGRMDLPTTRKALRLPGSITFRRAATAHRVELFRDANGTPIAAWSLFLTGPVMRPWGFWCAQGWRHWREFTAGEHGEIVGRGCGEG